MAFDNVTFPSLPIDVDYGRTVIDPVNVVSNGSYEYRIRKHRFEKFKWDVPTQTMTDAQKEEVRNFLAARSNGLNSFKFQDPAYKRLTNATLRQASGNFYELMLPYGTGVPGNHPIFNPDINSFTATTGTVQGFSISSTGIPVIEITGAGATAEVSGDIYFTVRLNSSFSETLLALDCNNTPTFHGVNSISLMEVFGEY